MSVAAAISVIGAACVRRGATKIGRGSGVGGAAPSPFRMCTRKPISHPIFRILVATSSMQPFHTATASALMTSMLTLSRLGYAWLPQGIDKTR